MTKIESNMSDMKDMMRKFMERFIPDADATGTVAEDKRRSAWNGGGNGG